MSIARSKAQNARGEKVRPSWDEEIQDAAIESLLNERDRLRNHLVAISSHSAESLQEKDLQQTRILEIQQDLVESEARIAAARGDFLQGDPRSMSSTESPEERGNRLLARREELRGSGVYAWQKRMTLEEGVSQSRMRQLLTAAEKRIAAVSSESERYAGTVKQK